MKKFFALIASFALAFTLIIPGIALGDAGSFSGSSNYGSSSSSSSSSSKSYSSSSSSSSSKSYSSSSSSSSSSSKSYDDYSRSKDDTTYYSSSSSSDDWTDEDKAVVGFIGLCVIIFFIGRKIVTVVMDKREEIAREEAAKKRKAQPAGAAITPQSELRKLSELVQRDPDFNKKDVEERIANIYVKMQNAWTAGDFEPMRPYFDNAMFAQFTRQLKQMKDKGLTNYVDNITVLEVTARGWYKSGKKEHIVLKVRTRINDYIMDAKGKCVQGTPTRELFMEYEYTISRPDGTKTAVQGKHADSKHCPNCGAPLDEAASARCPYCDSVITIDQHDWVITAIKGISQQSAN